MFNLTSPSALRHALLSGAAALGLLAGLPLQAKKDKGPEKLTQPGKYEDWNDIINQLEIKESFKITDFAEVRLLPVDTSKTALPDKEDNTYDPTVSVLKHATGSIIEGMKGELKAPPINTGDMPAPAPAAPPAAVADSAAAPAAPAAAPRILVIRVRIVELNPGSRAARYWGGFGAGKSSVEFEGDAIDGASGKVLLHFSITRSSSGAWKVAGGDYERMMTGDVQDAGSDIGTMLAFFK